MCKVAAQFFERLEYHRKQHCGSLFDHLLCLDRMKRYSMYNISSIFLQAQILRQDVSGRIRLHVSTG